jgi:hypothetical protein
MLSENTLRLKVEEFLFNLKVGFRSPLNEIVASEEEAARLSQLGKRMRSFFLWLKV